MNALFVALALVSAVDSSELLDAIVKEGHHKIAVCPLMISRLGPYAEGTRSTIGPRTFTNPRNVYQELVQASNNGPYAGKFSVISEAQVNKAIRDLSVTTEDLADPDKLKKFLDHLGADELVVMNANLEMELSDNIDKLLSDRGRDDKGSRKVEQTTVDVVSKYGDTRYSEDYREELSLRSRAYRGESWALRRWEGDKLVATGLSLLDNKAFGKGDQWEIYQANYIKGDVVHPASDATFPYQMRIFAQGSERKPVKMASKNTSYPYYLVELNPGEEYEIELENLDKRDVYVALYVDGISTIDKQLLEPDQLPTQKHWHLPANSGTRRVTGWTVRKGGSDNKGEYDIAKFKVVERSESVASKQGFDDQIGQITAIFFTLGMKGVEQPTGTPPTAALYDKFPYRPGLDELGEAVYGTGEGAVTAGSLDETSNEEPGLILGAWTVYYRTGDQIADMVPKDQPPIIDPVRVAHDEVYADPDRE